MRLRKLILSTGLAVAMVATTIPVGAATNTTATPEFTLNGETADQDGVAKVVTGGSVTKETATTKEGIIYTTTVTGDLTVKPTTSQLTSTTDAILNEYLGDDLSLVAKTSGGKITVTEVKKYALKDYKYDKGAKDDTLVNEKANALAAATADLKNVAEKASDNNTTPGGTYKVEVGEVVVAAATYTNGEGDPISTTDTDPAVSSLIVNKVTLEVTTTYTITDLAALGMTYDVVYTDTKNAKDNLVFSVIKYDGKTVSEVESTKVSNGTVVSLTDLTADYYLVVKKVSTAEDLITDFTDPNGLDVTITGGIVPSTKEKEKIDASVKENGYTLVNYLNISVKDGGKSVTSTDKEITFTIDVPVDMPEGVTYKVLRLHDGIVDVLDTTVADGKITFTSRLFSDFALVYTPAAAETPAETPAEDPAAEAPANEDTQAPTTTEAANGTSSTSASGVKSGDNSMMPIVVVSLLLALCAGSVAVYKEKKTL
jgi:hypothetical protein